jgi:hypothetical protein
MRMPRSDAAWQPEVFHATRTTVLMGVPNIEDRFKRARAQICLGFQLVGHAPIPGLACLLTGAAATRPTERSSNPTHFDFIGIPPRTVTAI